MIKKCYNCDRWHKDHLYDLDDGHAFGLCDEMITSEYKTYTVNYNDGCIKWKEKKHDREHC